MALSPLEQLRCDDAARQVLEVRARALARQEQAKAVSLAEEVLAFRLGDAGYCVPARCVREVQPLGRYTRLPATPPFVLGLVHIRGRLLAAIDLRPLLGAAPLAPAPGARLVVLAAEGLEIGLLADQVSEVRPGDAELAPSLASAAGNGAPWVRGVDRQLHLALDPALLVADPRLTGAGAAS